MQNQTFSTILNGRKPLMINNMISSKNTFYISFFFWEWIWKEKKIQIWHLGLHFIALIVGFQSIRAQEWQGISFIYLKSKSTWSCSTCFFMIDMPLTLWYYESLWHLVGKPRILKSTISLWQTMHHITWLYLKSVGWLLSTLKNAQVAKVI
jgi:hypothetical protein